MNRNKSTPKHVDGRGGARPGAGRPRLNARTLSFRVPQHLLDHIESQPSKSDYIKQCIEADMQRSKQAADNHSQPVKLHDIADIRSLDGAKTGMIPNTELLVACGQPIWADNQKYNEPVDALGILTGGHDGCIIMQAIGDSMIGDQIHSGDTVIVDTTVHDVNEKDIALCSVDNELTLKHVHRNADGTFDLNPSNPDYQPIHITNADQFAICGEVVSIIKTLK